MEHGDAGVGLLREFRQNSALSYEIVGFIDDDPAKVGSFIHRLKSSARAPRYPFPSSRL